jgi:hypothetical protein
MKTGLILKAMIISRTVVTYFLSIRTKFSVCTGGLLAEAQGQAASKEGVLKALDNAAISLRSKVGESLDSVLVIRV